MLYRKSTFHYKNKIYNFGKISFYTGTFFLASALPIAVIFFIFSIAISIYFNRISLYKDKWNFVLLISSVLMIISSAKASFNGLPQQVGFEKSEIWLNLFNWIPQFTLFSTMRVFLKTKIDRIKFTKYFLTGSLPVIVSCILQKWFNWYGPHETLNGLIVWFNEGRGDLYETSALSGLFSNPNYTGFWLSTIFPLTLGVLLYKKRSLIKNTFILTFIIVTFYLTLLTFSRNAIIGLFTSLAVILGTKIFFQIFLISFLAMLMINYISSIFLPGVSLIFLETIFPKAIISKFMVFDISNFKHWTRLVIWNNAIKLIFSRPIFGFGAVSFSLFFISKYNFGHIHNMPIQLAFDYGVPLSLLLSSFVVLLLIKSWIKLFSNGHTEINPNENIIDKCWLVASLVAVLSHLNDITYYDGKISILIWIFLAGLVCINNENTAQS